MVQAKDKPMWLSSTSGKSRDLSCGEAGHEDCNCFEVKFGNTREDANVTF